MLPASAKAERFQVWASSLGEEGVDLGKLNSHDIILLDLNLPDVSGYDVLRKLRQAEVQTPILILSGSAGIESKVKALGFGADDYLTKPFHKDELVARIHAIMRRSAADFGAGAQLRRSGDQRTAEARRGRGQARPADHERVSAAVLAERQGSTITKETFSTKCTAESLS